MGSVSNTVSFHGEGPLHVLVVTNYWEAKREFPFAGVFVDRQLASLKNLGVEITTLDIGRCHSPVTIFRKWLELRREVRGRNPNLVHGQYGTIVGMLVAFAGRPAVISFCGNDLLPGASIPTWRMYLCFLLSNLAAVWAKGLICKSESLRQALWWRRNRAVVIPNGVDLDFFSPGPRDEARHRLGWDIKRSIVLFNAGSDPQRKGLDLAGDAIKVARSLVPDIEMHIVSRVDPHLMPLYYRAADVLLCASKAEGSPNVVKEALACNLPIVSTPVGDVPELLVGVHPSAVVPPDRKIIAESLARILLVKRRNNGRECISHLSIERVGQQVLGLYRAILATHDW